MKSIFEILSFDLNRLSIAVGVIDWELPNNPIKKDDQTKITKSDFMQWYYFWKYKSSGKRV